LEFLEVDRDIRESDRKEASFFQKQLSRASSFADIPQREAETIAQSAGTGKSG
jgi:hypothetical protein